MLDGGTLIRLPVRREHWVLHEHVRDRARELLWEIDRGARREARLGGTRRRKWRREWARGSKVRAASNGAFRRDSSASGRQPRLAVADAAWQRRQRRCNR